MTVILSDEDHRRATELMRAIRAETTGWDPYVTILYVPSEALRSGTPFQVKLAVKAYRRKNRMRSAWKATPVEALEWALAEMTATKLQDEDRERRR